MGSRAVVVVCRDEAAARARASASTAARRGICLHAHRAAFFDDRGAGGGAARARPRRALDAAGLWDELDTDWVCLDCELMPWSAKAQELLRSQYAAVGAAAPRGARRGAWRRCDRPAARGLDVGDAARRAAASAAAARRAATSTPTAATAGRCASLDDLKLAPFHLLASEGARPRRPRPRLAHGDAGAARARPTRRCCSATGRTAWST